MISRITILILFSLSILFIIFGCDQVTAPDTVHDPSTPVTYELVWADEFNQDSNQLNSDSWDYDTGYGSDGWGNDEWQNYTDSSDNITVENGAMVISALCPSGVPGKRDGSITSARVKTQNKFSTKFGKIQARIKAPTGNGMWPAFWMLGNSFDTAGWPYCGEIDIMEISPLLHGLNTTMCTMHWWDDETETHRSYGTTYTLSEPLSEDYHVYEVEWDEQRIVGRIDDIIYFTKVIDPITMNEFLQNFFLIFNVAVGGNLGGAPTSSTTWPQQMFVDWVRIYQNEESLIPIETYGIFTDETPVDDGLTIGADAEVYVWESTLTNGTILPYEGPGVLSWQTTGAGWFGGGISSNMPVDLSTFENGMLKFMVKIPADVTFKIGIIDTQGNENYVTFPANQTAYSLERNGEWDQAIIPVADLKGNVNLQMLSYEFAILEENGANCEFAIDDIYYDGGGSTPALVSFDANTYTLDATSATITVTDEAAADSTVAVTIDNGTESISVDVALDATGTGVSVVTFGPTNDDTDTIAISANAILTATYLDASGNTRTDSATIEGGSGSSTIGIYSETHTDPMLSYSSIINSADWSGNSAAPDEQSTAITPLDGTYALSVEFTDLGAGWGGIAFDFGAQDISTMETLVLSINNASMPTLAYLGVKLEDNAGGNTEVNIANYTPTYTGSWATYELPLTDFPAVNLADLKYLGLWNPYDNSNNLLFGTLYFDNIYLDDDSITPPPVDTAGIFSESHTNPMIPYTQIINSADWSGNSAAPDEESIAVTPVDGTYVLAVEFTDLGAGWGGIAFDFAAQNISGYTALVININKSQMPTLSKLGIKLEDNSGGNTEVNISAYTPQISGAWEQYSIPLSDFPNVNLADLKYLGLWNPNDSSNNFLLGNLYFDDIYLEE
jgi:beta-glucanase (GH16 family)